MKLTAEQKEANKLARKQQKAIDKNTLKDWQKDLFGDCKLNCVNHL